MTASTAAPLLDLAGIVKTFPGQIALDDAALSVAHGEIHALVGQNGSGKSTIIKLLAGYHSPDSVGLAQLDGQDFTLGSAVEADQLGMRFIHQDLGLVGSLSSVENCALTRGFPTGRLWRINWREEKARVRGLLEQFGVDVDPELPVARLAPAQRTMVAIVRALNDWESSARLLVLDEPTATLPAAEVSKLFDVVRRVAANGLGVLFVSHRLDEVFDVAARVTVFRDGKNVLSQATTELDHQSLVRSMLGRTIANWEPATGVAGKPVLEVAGLAGIDLADFTATVHGGEIVGIAGLLGSGRDEVAPVLAGILPRVAGSVVVNGEPVERNRPRAAIKAGVALVPVDRAKQGAVTSFTLRENILLPRLAPLYKRGKLSRGLEDREAGGWVRDLDVRPANAEATFSNLSGGNQQKVVLAKCLRLKPEVLILDEPTQGVDIGAKMAIYAIIAERAAAGLAVLISSGDSEELSRVCNRVLVMVDGRCARELSGADLTAESIDLAVLREVKDVSRSE